MKKIISILCLLLAMPLMAQNVRFDLPVYTVQAQGGNLLPVYAVPGALVSFYNEPAGTLANTYNSATSTSPCPTGSQVVLNGSAACVSSADPYGNMGAWFLPGQYMATITGAGRSYDYYFTIAGSGGSGGLPAGPSFAVNFANSAVNAFQGDPNITINPTTHSLNAPLATTSTSPWADVCSPIYLAYNVGGVGCNGTTDDRPALDAALKAAQASVLPLRVYISSPQVTILSPLVISDNSTVSTNGVAYTKPVRIFGAGHAVSTITFSQAAPATGATPTSGINFDFCTSGQTGSPGSYSCPTSVPVEIDDLALTGNPAAANGVSRLLYVQNSTQGFYLHDTTVSGGGNTCTSSACPGSGGYGGVWFQDSDRVSIVNNIFTGNGALTASIPTGVQGGSDIGSNELHVRNADSENWRISGNSLYGSNTDETIGLTNVEHSRIVDNDCNQNDYIGSINTQGGYCFMAYSEANGSAGVGLWLSRSGNVVTATVPSSQYNYVGEHIQILGSHSTGGTVFDGDFIVTAVPNSTTVTWNQVAANDTAAGSGIGNTLQGNVVSNNHFANCAGTCAYFQSSSDATIIGNIIHNSGLQESATTLCVGGISVSQAIRDIVASNQIFDDPSISAAATTQDGICVGTARDSQFANNNITGTKNGYEVRGYAVNSGFHGGTVKNTQIGFYASSATSLLYKDEIEGLQIVSPGLAGIEGAFADVNLHDVKMTPAITGEVWTTQGTNYGLITLPTSPTSNFTYSFITPGYNNISKVTLNGLLPSGTSACGGTGTNGFCSEGMLFEDPHDKVTDNHLYSMFATGIEDVGTSNYFTRNEVTNTNAGSYGFNGVSDTGCVYERNSMTYNPSSACTGPTYSGPFIPLSFGNAPTAGTCIPIGPQTSSTITNALGTLSSTGGQFVAYNSCLTSATNWHQYDAAFSSEIFIVGGSGVQDCHVAAGTADGTFATWCPVFKSFAAIRAGTFTISSATSVAVTFSSVMSATPTSCSVTPSGSYTGTGYPTPSALSASGFTVNVGISGSLSGTYQCVINNSN